MKCIGSESTCFPPRVTIEHLPDQKTRIVLTDNVSEKTDEENNVFYVYDEVFIFLDEERSESVTDIEENFDDWWIYGSESESFSEPTLEERISTLEYYILEME